MRTIRPFPRPLGPSGSCGATLLLLLALTCAIVPMARAAELIPWVGVARQAKASDNRGQYFAGLSLRAGMLPYLQTEIGGAVRREPLPDNKVVWIWPVTASLWLSPHPFLYGGGGVGWYHTTLDYTGLQPARAAETTEKFGAHAGGGVRVPFGSAVALDLNARYVFMTRKEPATSPSRFGPDFWLTTLGLAIRL